MAILASIMSIYTFSVQAAANYDYEIVEKSPNPTLSHGEQIILWTTLKNTGSYTWYSDRENDYDPCFTDEFGNEYCTGALVEPTRLGTIRPNDRNSGFYTYNNWMSTNRTHLMDGNSVSPGEIASFGFIVTVPNDMNSGVYTECFAPVVEGITWMADKGLCWDINVVGQPVYDEYEAMIDESNNDSYQEFLLEPGQSRQVTFTVLNSGSATWERDGQYPVHLAVKYDEKGDFYNSTWLSENRPAKLREEVVYPGEWGHFDFYIEAPNDVEENYYGQRISDYYWLVAEGKTWFNDIDIDYYMMSLQADAVLVEDPAYQEELEQMSDAWQDIDSFAYDGVLQTEDYFGTSSYIADLNGEMDWHDEDEIISNLLMDMSYEYTDYYYGSNNIDMEIETRAQGDESYIRFYIKDMTDSDLEYLEELNDKWIRIDEDSIREMFEDMGLEYDELVEDTDQSDLISYENEVSDLIDDTDLMILTELVGTDYIDGEETNHYRFVMKESSSDYVWLADYAETSFSAYGYDGEVWIGQDDHLPYRLKFDDESYSENSSYDIYLSDYNDRFDFDRPDEYLTLTEVMDIFDRIIEDLLEGNIYAKAIVKEIL